MTLEEKFAVGAVNRSYRRIDSEFKTDIFVGYSNEGHMSLVIIEYGKMTVLKSSKLINVSMKRRTDGKYSMSFDLLDDSYKSLFLIFCRDMISVCEKSGPEMAISSAATRWKYWREMFGKKNPKILDKHEIKGLIGELIVLRDKFIKERGTGTAVNSWMGPLLGHKDFEIDDTWYEIKSISESSIQVTISSLEQLDSEQDGHLIIVRLEDSSTVNALAVNLNTVAASVMSLIDDPDVMELFRVRLENMGYAFDPEYENYSFLYKGTEQYLISEDFPSLTRKNVPDAISNLKYSILLNGISQYKEE